MSKRPQYTTQAAQLGNFVWYDVNHDGIQNPNEIGIPGVQVELYANTECRDRPDVVGVTDEHGYYTFNDVPPGTYSLKFQPLPGLMLTTPDQGMDDTRDSDADPRQGCTGRIVLTAGQVDMSWDAGMVGAGRVEGLVWVDWSGDGVHDPDETHGLPGIPIRVSGRNFLDVQVDITATTSLEGLYTVEFLAPGTYTVDAPESVDEWARTSGSPVEVTLRPAHMERTDVNFGYIEHTAVQLVDFQVVSTVQNVSLLWSIYISQNGAPRFRVWRRRVDEPWDIISQGWVTHESIRGHMAYYQFEDFDVVPGAHYEYRVESDMGDFFGPWPVAVPQADNGGSPLMEPCCFMPWIQGG